MSKEIWKDIPNYEDKYQISNHKNVKLKCRDIIDTTGELLVIIPESFVEIRNTEHDPYPHVILHDGKMYNKYSLDELYNSVFD